MLCFPRFYQSREEQVSSTRRGFTKIYNLLTRLLMLSRRWRTDLDFISKLMACKI